MKIIRLVESPHGLKGNTARLLYHVLEGAKASGIEIGTPDFYDGSPAMRKPVG